MLQQQESVKKDPIKRQEILQTGHMATSLDDVTVYTVPTPLS